MRIVSFRFCGNELGFGFEIQGMIAVPVRNHLIASCERRKNILHGNKVFFFSAIYTSEPMWFVPVPAKNTAVK